MAERTTPIIVSVFDASGETLEFPLNTEITARPAAPEDDETTPEEPVEEPSAPTEETEGENDLTPTEGGADGTEDTTTPEDTTEPVEGDDSTPPEPVEDVPSPDALLRAIRDTQSMHMRVNYMMIAVETVSNPGFITKVNVNEQIAFRKDLLSELEKEIIEFMNT